MSEKNTESPKARYWRSLNEMRQSSDFSQYIEREFPVAASEYPEGVSRRRWIQMMGASLALGGAIGCRYPEESIAPFVIRPEGRVPGEAYSRATNFEWAGRVYNLLISCVDGRPIKVEGNDQHPFGRGGTDVYSQASILSLYDPDRLGSVMQFRDGKMRPAEWDDFATYLRTLTPSLRASEGRSLAVLMESTSSPSLVRMLEELQQAMPQATLVRYDSVRSDVMRKATAQAIGREGEPVLDLAKAEVVLTVQADILGQDRNMIHNSRSFVDGRHPMEGQMSRLYAVEAGYTNTGATADSRLALRPSDAIEFLAALEAALDGDDLSTADIDGEKAYDLLSPQERAERFLAVAAADLDAAGDKAVVVVGEHLGADAVAAGIRINNKLGSLNKLVRFAQPVDASLKTIHVAEFLQRAASGTFDSVLVLGNNLAFSAPSDLDLAGAISRIRNSIYWGEYDDETAALCDWQLPAAHPLESWGDTISDSGHYGVCQPQILPLLNGRTSLEVLAMLLEKPDTSPEAIVRATADQIAGSSLSNRQWRTLLHDGYSEELKVEIADAEYTGSDDPLSDGTLSVTYEINQNDIEIVFTAADGIYDGRFANNGWLQEMPQALTKLTWDNAALMSPHTARQLKVKHGTMVALRRGEVSLEVPVYEMPGMAHGCTVLAYGYGRTRAGAIGGFKDMDLPSVGTDVRPLRTSDSMLVAYNMESRPRTDEYELATTQDHWAIDELGREEAEERSYKLIREGTLALLEKTPQFTAAKAPHVPDYDHTKLWEKEPMEALQEAPELDFVPQWGMSVDLTKCTGCNACVIACQSENNVPIVGKDQVLDSREMHWMRIDRYFQGNEDNADVVQEPLMCMHCETAPCEQVCPVAATVHTNEGINAMAYNRCIGTRYCANNCPFKVRRFNYFNFNSEVGVGYGIDAFPGSIESANRKLQQLVLNPEVTVRGRGVMEKCTYCIQRVEAAKIDARKEGRAIRDGDVKTACQTACPTRAIEFGNIADPHSKVAQAREDVRTYGMLPQLRVKPRTTYMSRIRNTPPLLMTTAQISDLNTLHEKLHHHGDHGESHDEHADDHHDHEGDHDHDNTDAKPAGEAH
ncbi:TAT-variant-translocated molybdopterin oxidoreductase [Roseimaritima sediminicola]|uniref:TAT-variant-translocated molybdopterin oxidoreductase n=1 Tax=Roseimaritima sediminicola TaxID=2662066 RepID=UPI0012982727|nr:TAT-variant-translocated molybdopterin oxidoreductase [Roseimaritima sediminicola]